MVVTFANGAWAGYVIGWKRGFALTPTDHVLRDVVRQRDQLMRERDEARLAYAHVVDILEATRERGEARLQ
jgi:hypothetical protein